METNNKNEKYKTWKVLDRLNDKEKKLESDNIQQIKDLLEKLTDQGLKQEEIYELEKLNKTINDLVSPNNKTDNNFKLDKTYKSSKLKIGDEIKFGTYHNSDISWIILDIQEGKALILSKYSLLSMRYHDKKKELVTWETCTLRKWLNNDFYKEAFNGRQKAAIETVSIDNTDDSKNGTKSENKTNDKIFLLSIDEAKKYFSSDDERKARNVNGSTAWWWLRSPGSYYITTAEVRGEGYINQRGYGVNYSNGVRPALWIDLNSDFAKIE